MSSSPGYQEGSREWLRAELASDLAADFPWSKLTIYAALEVLEETDVDDPAVFFTACAQGNLEPVATAHELRRAERAFRQVFAPEIPVDRSSPGWIAGAVVMLAGVTTIGVVLATRGELSPIDFAGLSFLVAAALFIAANELRKPR